VVPGGRPWPYAIKLRGVLDQVAGGTGGAQVRKGEQQPAGFVLSGPRHCLELLRSGDTGHGGANSLC